MLLSMAFSQTDLDKLDAAIAAGERVVAFGDRRVEYRDVGEMLKARALVASSLAAAQSQQTLSPRYRQATFCD